ncbi:hypothetical protein IJ182_10930 [bacterium]|nr:hypothetical protein [bacterium]
MGISPLKHSNPNMKTTVDIPTSRRIIDNNSIPAGIDDEETSFSALDIISRLDRLDGKSANAGWKAISGRPIDNNSILVGIANPTAEGHVICKSRDFVSGPDRLDYRA